jgi:hypothetical protein
MSICIEYGTCPIYKLGDTLPNQQQKLNRQQNQRLTKSVSNKFSILAT